MMFTKAFTLAAAFATLSSALPHVVRRNDTSSGSVTIVNNMSQDIYAWSVADTVNPMQTLSANGGSYTEQWRVNSNGGGVSIKLSTTEEQVDVLQFEYTENGDTIFWDVSCIDMDPAASEFSKVGFSVSNTDSGSCPTITCAAGDDACAETYLKPDDDHATHGCPISTGFTLELGQ